MVPHFLQKISGRKETPLFRLHILYVLGLFLGLHSAIPMYANSKFLESFVGEETVGIVFSLASLAALVTLFNLPHVLKRLGAYKTTATLISLNILALIALATAESPLVLVGAFIVHFLLVRGLFYVLDILVENVTAEERTGIIRGTLLTVLSIAILFSPLILGIILGEGEGYSLVYLVGGALLIPALFLLAYGFRNFKDPFYEDTQTRRAMSRVFGNADLFNVFAAGFLLRFFFAWMIIYTPIYLIETMGFDWATVGTIFFFMLIPFVLFQIPLGKLADNYTGEKEILALGFIIVGGTTALLSFITTPSVAVWALLLFATRIGASFVEIATESYFFKKIKPEDSNVVALYRAVDPIAYIVAPLVSTLALLVIDIRYTFVVLGAIMLTGVVYALKLHDSR
jgi:MFS family permease